MKAAVLYGDNDIRYEDWEKPEAQAGEVLVKVKESGLCGSDIPRTIHGGAHFYPIVLGHEFSGEIVALGEAVSERKVGDRIACVPLIPDRNDPQSQKGNYSLSKGYKFIGSRIQGGWSEYVTMPWENAVVLPDAVSYTEGAFFEPITVALHALNIMKFEGGKDVAITGMGTIGLLALQCVRAMGARKVTVFDIDESRLELAKELGADLCLNTMNEGFKDEAMGFTNGIGYEVCLETGGVPITEILCLDLAAPKGTVMFIGTPHKPVTLQPHEFENINRKEIIVTGSWMNYSAPFPGWEWEMANYLFSKNLVKTEPLIDRKIPLSQAADALADLLKPGAVKGKILFDCSK
ncbi:galactitol-1-phosphate 5-dehydrogenase [Oceanispirochaeta sp.]|jgi:threonine dehydrogenase-like Zn-dependent dehydrogenase|uniref:galactitol-1-phosphate 5-dehydrogenase n=1 Tax=Oceanispirochaeta sp. TaxID=2035350 RepID=UPI002637C107|nr:galactitol-1-phosphate 5-dehydrogenase [Oceanispirochaeta sp.]MDA3956067.1 galactitol-1-phosphate 5-dehydrogenase [Oceanispirochaeta sp.]